MTNILKNFFITLSNNELLNKSAQRWGLRFGVEKFVAGTNIESALQSVKALNEKGISCTVDHLGEFVTDAKVSLTAKNNIIQLLEQIHEQNLQCHISVKLTQLGLDIDEEFCLENMREILQIANEYDIFVNIDMEDYAHYEQTLHILRELRKEFTCIGTVIQSYLYRAEQDMDELKNVRLRLVKGAYKESEDVAYQSKEEIDRNFVHLIKKRLKENTFTSIATHDHHIINEVKRFVEEEGIDKSTFEFQMLYGFRTELQEQLANEGYNFCTYIPFGEDWYGYFMRRLAERPQNLNLLIKDQLYTSDNQLKKTPLIIGAASVATLLLLLRKRKK